MYFDGDVRGAVAAGACIARAVRTDSSVFGEWVSER